MLQTLRKSGGSLVMTLPKAFVEQHQLKAGDDVDLTISADSMKVVPAFQNGLKPWHLAIGSGQSPTHTIHIHGGVEISCCFTQDLESICRTFNSTHLLIDSGVFTILRTDCINCIAPIKDTGLNKFLISFASQDSIKIEINASKLLDLPRYTDDENVSRRKLYPRFELVDDVIICASQITSFSPIV